VTIERLQKIISHAGLMSRRAAEELIRAGRVSINGRVAVLGDRGDAEEVDLRIDGVPVPVAPSRVTYLLYKPVGVVSTASDPEGRTTVVEMVPPEPRVYPVGRLDADSEGLLLLSNDGALTHAITHPSFGVTKTYSVLVEGRLSDRDLRRLRGGVELDDGLARPIAVKATDRASDRTLVELVMAEGRKREVRRMMAAVGHDVIRLVRTAIGPITDRALKSGEWRKLDTAEVAALYSAADWDQT
jgi:23S rRNA pseudouridine2605 synthase